MDLTLLPEPDVAMRCADHARMNAVDPGGSAIQADLMVAVEAPLPWPKPVFAHELLGGVRELMNTASVPTRILAAVPERPEEGLSVIAYRRRPWGADRSAWLTSPAHLAETTAAVVADETPPNAQALETPQGAEVWVCTQGSHDLCCGSDGTRLAMDLTDRWDDVIVRRVSHTGGHRFAPTAITLPDGRMWAYVDPDGMHDILTRSGDTSNVVDRCRGWWGAPKGPEQVAERQLLAAEGWTWEAAPRSTEVIGQDDGVWTIRVTAGEGVPRTWLARVEVGREIPTISCNEPGGQPAKPGVEYRLIDFAAE